nr:hypothetical protein [uncultured Allomuricauda sp.]
MLKVIQCPIFYFWYSWDNCLAGAMAKNAQFSTGISVDFKELDEPYISSVSY